MLHELSPYVNKFIALSEKKQVDFRDIFSVQQDDYLYLFFLCCRSLSWALLASFSFSRRPL